MTQSPYSAPEANVSRQEPLEQSLTKRVILFLLGAVAFTVIFWSLWFTLLRPVFSPPSGDTSADARDQANMKAQDDLMRKYQDQAKAADEYQQKLDRYLEVSTELQRRQMELLSKQEEQARRFDEVLRRWEAQTGAKR